MLPIFPIPYHFVAHCSAGVLVSWKIGKVEKEKALNHHKQESNKKRLCSKIYREITITHTTLVHSDPSQTSKMEPFAKMTEYYCLVLKLTTKSKGLEKEAWKWLYSISRWIYCLFKTNPAVTYEMDCYIFEQEISFILSRAENVQNRNFWKTVYSNQSDKRNLGIIMKP